MTPTGSTALWNGLMFPPCSAAVFENSSKIVIVMEYASRGDLYDYISERPRLSEQDARHFFRQIVSAVHYCHLVSSTCQLSSKGVPGALGLSRIPQGDKQRQKLIWTWALGRLASLAVAPRGGSLCDPWSCVPTRWAFPTYPCYPCWASLSRLGLHVLLSLLETSL